MIQITPQMRVLVAIEAADFRRGIDGLAQLCRHAVDPHAAGGYQFLAVAARPDAGRCEVLLQSFRLHACLA